jgi:hypothetical protein
MPLVQRCRWWNPNHPVPSRLNDVLPPTESVTRRGGCWPGESPYRGLNRGLLSTASALPKGEARSRAVHNTVIIFIAEYGCAASDKWREKPCDWLLGTLIVFATGTLNNSPLGTVLINACWTRLTLSRIRPQGAQTMFATGQTICSGWKHGDPCPSRRRSLCCDSFESAAPGCCHTPSVGDQTSEGRSGLPLAHQTLDGVGSDRVHEQRFPRPDGGRSQREAQGLDL